MISNIGNSVSVNSIVGNGYAGSAGSGNNNLPVAYLNMIMLNNDLETDPSLPMSPVHITTAANMQKGKIMIYYPFGLSISDRQITQEPYRYGYQGQFAEKDSAYS